MVHCPIRILAQILHSVALYVSNRRCCLIYFVFTRKWIPAAQLDTRLLYSLFKPTFPAFLSPTTAITMHTIIYPNINQ
jgi:hypothetical protein